MKYKKFSNIFDTFKRGFFLFLGFFKNICNSQNKIGADYYSAIFFCGKFFIYSNFFSLLEFFAFLYLLIFPNDFTGIPTSSILAVNFSYIYLNFSYLYLF